MGDPPTDLKALTGELTPPGITFCACSNNFLDLLFMSLNILRP